MEEESSGPSHSSASLHVALHSDEGANHRVARTSAFEVRALWCIRNGKPQTARTAVCATPLHTSPLRAATNRQEEGTYETSSKTSPPGCGFPDLFVCRLDWEGTAAASHRDAGSPGATTTINGYQLPPPPQPFGGKIERNAAQSTPYWPMRVEPRQGAPNILLIMTDDSGFGVPSTFGGVIPTPALDRIAAMGLRYTNFNSTALCSPTRAALITGRNHHSVGFGVIAEQSTGYPGYNSIIPRDKATIGRILKDNGYRTSWFGKDHNTPEFQASQDGPFDQWPTGMGFEYFYGFVGGDANQWQPNLFRNTAAIYPYVGHPGWNLTTGMADDAIQYLNRIKAVAPDQPFFIYYVPAAPMRLTTLRQNGSRRLATCTCSTRAGTNCATRSSPTRSGWA